MKIDNLENKNTEYKQLEAIINENLELKGRIKGLIQSFVEYVIELEDRIMELKKRLEKYEDCDER